MNVLRFLLASALLASLASPAHSAWSHDPLSGHVPVCTAPGDLDSESGRVVADGGGGAIYVWTDLRADLGDIYAQRVGADGTVKWTADGVAIANPAFQQYDAAVTTDGASGALIAWTSTGPSGMDVYIQRIDSTGAVRWTAGGVLVCAASGNQANVSIAPDGSGGAFVAWQDTRTSTDWDVYVQHVSSTGTLLWTANGALASAATNAQYESRVAADGLGGVFVVWQDSRNGMSDIYAQRLDVNGAAQWPTNGIALCAAVGQQASPMLVTPLPGALIAAWSDGRTGMYDVYAQAVLASGQRLWTTDGVPLSAATADQLLYGFIPDGTGGAIASWYDYRDGVAYDIYAQRIDGAGVSLWAADGAPVCVRAGSQFYPSMVSDGAGGALMVWQDQRSPLGSYDLYAQHVGGDGGVRWAADGVAVCTLNGAQMVPLVTPDGAGGLVVGWTDFRSGSQYDLYAQRVDRYGYLGQVEPQGVTVRDVPNDEGGQVKVAWQASYPDPLGDANVASYDLWRSVPSTVVTGRVARGERVAPSFDEASGVEAPALVRFAGEAWEYVGTQPAVHYLPAYSWVAATTGDSVAGSDPLTSFLVVARDAGNTRHWPSTVATGHSVDDLAPPAPAPFAGAYALSGTALTWQASPAADFASFRLHRGGSASFTPGPANLVASTTATGYVDAAGGPYWYKLSAVDVHGNESAFSTLLPSGSLAVEGALPAALALAAPAPNPARTHTTLTFALPRPARVRLALYDAGGRRVRTLVDGTRAAGTHAAAWDLRDEAGHAVGAGLYFATLECEGARVTRRVMTLR